MDADEPVLRLATEIAFYRTDRSHHSRRVRLQLFSFCLPPKMEINGYGYLNRLTIYIYYKVRVLARTDPGPDLLDRVQSGSGPGPAAGRTGPGGSGPGPQKMCWTWPGPALGQSSSKKNGTILIQLS